MNKLRIKRANTFMPHAVLPDIADYRPVVPWGVYLDMVTRYIERLRAAAL